MKNLFAYIDENTEKYLAFWETICFAEGTAYDVDAINRVNDIIKDFAENEGFFVKTIPFENCGDYLVIDTLPAGEKGCAFMAHSDTVHEIGAFGIPAVKREGDKIYGPGVIDCKGGIAIALLTMKALKENGYNKNLRLLISSDEEVSNRLSGEKGKETIKNQLCGYKAAFNCEVGRENEAVVSRKGVFRCSIKITGVASHSGIDYVSGRSAVREAAYKIIAMENQSDPKKITYNCGIIQGGTRPNIVPENCEITVDVRVNNGAEMAEAENFVRSIAEKSFVKGTKSQLTILSRRDAFLRDENTEILFKKLSKISKQYGFGEITPIESGGGSDSAYSQMAGVPSICAVGAFGDYCHTTREFAYIRSLEKQSKLLSAIVLEL